MLRVTVLISLGLLLRDSVFDFSRCCGFCLGLCVSVFVVSSQVHMELEFLDSICYSELKSKNLEMLVFDSELCHSTLKPIGDEEDTLKSFMAFHITQRVPVFRVVVGS